MAHCGKCGAEVEVGEDSVCPNCGASAKPLPLILTAGNLGCVGIVLAVGGGFFACAGSIATDYTSAWIAAIVGSVGALMVVAAILMAVNRWMTTRK
jgi:hypothetical protein